MKKILLLSTFLIFACSGGDDKNSLTEFNLKGKVESVYTTSFTATEKFGEVTKDDWEESGKQKYDDKGNQIEDAYYDKDGKLRWKYKAKFDDKGNLIEMELYEDGEFVYTETYELEYDSKDNWIKKITYKDDKPTFISEREIEYYN